MNSPLPLNRKRTNAMAPQVASTVATRLDPAATSRLFRSERIEGLGGEQLRGTTAASSPFRGKTRIVPELKANTSRMTSGRYSRASSVK